MSKQEGVEQVSIDLKAGTATVAGEGFDPAKLKLAVENAGFEVA